MGKRIQREEGRQVWNLYNTWHRKWQENLGAQRHRITGPNALHIIGIRSSEFYLLLTLVTIKAGPDSISSDFLSGSREQTIAELYISQRKRARHHLSFTSFCAKVNTVPSMTLLCHNLHLNYIFFREAQSISDRKCFPFSFSIYFVLCTLQTTIYLSLKPTILRAGMLPIALVWPQHHNKSPLLYPMNPMDLQLTLSPSTFVFSTPVIKVLGFPFDIVGNNNRDTT